MGVDTNAMRCFARVRNMCSTVGNTALSSVLDAAADEIDALRAEVERLRALHACEIERRAVAEGREKAYRDEVRRVHALLGMAREFAVGRFSVAWRSEGAWAVVKGSSVLNRDGQWEWEASPSGRDADFIDRTRYTLDEALDVARALVEREAKECKSCCGSGVRDDGRWGGITDTTPCSECNGTGVAETDGAVEKCECDGKGA